MTVEIKNIHDRDITVIRADEGKVFRRKHDGFVMGNEIFLGIDYSLGYERVDCGTINFIVIPRSYGNLKIVMSLVPDADYGWDGFSGFYARTNTGVVTQLTAPDFQDDFVLSYVDFDVFHVVYTAYGD